MKLIFTDFVKLIYTKFINLLPLEQYHDKSMGMYGGDLLTFVVAGHGTQLPRSVNIKLINRPPHSFPWACDDIARMVQGL